MLARSLGRWAWVGIVVFALGGCGRKGGLDLPPSAANAPPQADATDASGNVIQPATTGSGAPAASSGRKRPFLLDPLLND